MSEIYPVDDLEYENNSLGNEIRAAILELPNLADDECEDLLATLNESGLADQRPVAALIGLAADAGSFWEDLRVGELKTLLALAIGDDQAIREGCDWIRYFAQINADRRRVYACIETLLKLSDLADFDGLGGPYREALASLYGPSVLGRAAALLSGEQRFFGVAGPGLALDGCAMHRRLLEAYGKVHRQHAQAV
jgi:ribosomal protein S12 methylthiotransferase accessory factor